MVSKDNMIIKMHEKKYLCKKEKILCVTVIQSSSQSAEQELNMTLDTINGTVAW